MTDFYYKGKWLTESQARKATGYDEGALADLPSRVTEADKAQQRVQIVSRAGKLQQGFDRDVLGGTVAGQSQVDALNKLRTQLGQAPVSYTPPAVGQQQTTSRPPLSTTTQATGTSGTSKLNIASGAPGDDPALHKYDAFNAQFQKEYGRPITQAEQSDNDMLANKLGISNDLLRLLPIDRQMSFDAKRLALLSNEDLGKIIEFNPNVAGSFDTKRLAAFSNDFIQKTIKPYLTTANPVEWDNLSKAIGTPPPGQQPAGTTTPPIVGGNGPSAGPSAGPSMGPPGGPATATIPTMQGSTVTPPVLKQGTDYRLNMLNAPTLPSNIGSMTASQIYAAYAGAKTGVPPASNQPNFTDTTVAPTTPKSTNPKLQIASNADPYKQYGITQPYGNPDPKYSKGYNRGTDFGAPPNTPLPPEYGGVVVRAGENGQWGLSVQVKDAAGYIQQYSHLSSINVKPGDKVTPQSIIGNTGATGMTTGPHLDYMILDPMGNDIDPTTYKGPQNFEDYGNGQPPPTAGTTTQPTSPTTVPTAGGGTGLGGLTEHPGLIIVQDGVDKYGDPVYKYLPDPSYTKPSTAAGQPPKSAEDIANDRRALDQRDQQIAQDLIQLTNQMTIASNALEWDKARYYSEQIDKLQQQKDDLALQRDTLTQRQSEYGANLTQQQAEFGANLTQRQAEFGANLTQRQSEYGADLLQQESNRGLKREEDIGYVAGLPTLAREQAAAQQNVANYNAMANSAYQAAQVALKEGDQAEAKRQFDLSYKLQQKASELQDKEFGLKEKAAALEQSRNPASFLDKGFRAYGEVPPVTGIPNNGGYAATSPGGGHNLPPVSTLGGGLNVGVAGIPPAVTGQPLRSQDILQNPQLLPGLRQAFAGQTGANAIPLVSGQAASQLLPSDRKQLDAGLTATGVDPEDYWTQQQRRSQTGTAPIASRTRRPIRKVYSGV